MERTSSCPAELSEPEGDKVKEEGRNVEKQLKESKI